MEETKSEINKRKLAEIGKKYIMTTGVDDPEENLRYLNGEEDL